MKQISILTPADLAHAYQIEQTSHAFPWTEKIFTSNQGKLYLNYKLSIDHRIVGFVITQKVRDEATLFNIAIDPQHQRRGYGRLLLEYLLEQLMVHSVITVWLEVRESNVGAIALYENLGFNQVSLRHNYYPCAHGREHAVIMALSVA
ncbi:ribosomal protein S18-alanine N-acetyltransferase [Candidatus Fukatsuia symbiotica]|uniref:[Ribosomal protein bS18]-alanine N-acetyltransferase n=1 Tax=Candidatus Fukatsuia symbiotica TaxID=1878942 RepID=A0A2U8I4G2_9GAMM|nr:ribosomal protein S18-alanine N-acetyltransferase [Candidatus Fukatsuia symbiotica]AWK14022.1 ribosomal-protein-alanine N-acetyltransferase [Candidatus Fukatsuia symbiotica]MEA9445624.1 ribosomal protein S18-alanine N-acetyltransferase [Candidatus Fukatsuia symbiotica]